MHARRGGARGCFVLINKFYLLLLYLCARDNNNKHLLQGAHKVSARALHQRALAAEHLQGSAAIVNARGAQSSRPSAKGWVQLTTFR